MLDMTIHPWRVFSRSGQFVAAFSGELVAAHHLILTARDHGQGRVEGPVTDKDDGKRSYVECLHLTAPKGSNL